MNSSPPIKIGRYRVNLVLFLVLIVLTVLWFHRHLQLFVTQSLFVGGTLTLWGLAKIIQSWIPYGEPGHAKLLARVNATEALILGLIALGLLYLSTSSVFLIFEGAPAGTDKVKVRITEQGLPYFPDIELKPYDKVFGRPFFFRKKKLNLHFEIVEPPGYEPKFHEFHSWTNISLRVPGDFEERKLFLLQLVPGPSLYNLLPKSAKEQQTAYCLRLSCGKKPVLILKDWLFQKVILGVKDRREMEFMEKKSLAQGQVEIRDYFITQSVPIAKVSEILQWIESNDSRFLTDWELANGDRVRIELIYEDGTLKKHWEFTLVKKPKMQRFYLER